MIKRVKCEVYKETLMCDNCGAEMQWGGKSLRSSLAQSSYYCPNCGEIINTAGDVYPNIFFEEEE